MPTLVVGLFGEEISARRAVRDLEEASILSADITFISGKVTDAGDEYFPSGRRQRGDAVAIRASIGGALGAGAGLLTGFGILSISGLGSIVAAGWLAAAAMGAIAGAAAGGVMGLLWGAGSRLERAQTQTQNLERGDSVVAVRTKGVLASTARAILAAAGGVDPDDRSARFRDEGSNHSEETSAPFAGPEHGPTRAPLRYRDMLRH
jgi:hypothetical protein